VRRDRTGCWCSVAGGLPERDRDLPGARPGAADAVAELVDDAAAAGVVLAIEPMHPIYAADRGVISTLGRRSTSPSSSRRGRRRRRHVPRVVGPAARRAAAPRRAPDRRLPGVRLDHPAPAGRPARPRDDGRRHIDFAAVTRLVTEAGYAGDIEVEIFNQAIWDADPLDVALRTVKSFDRCDGA
jgi:sugar phosphate isomerase/epimerase